MTHGGPSFIFRSSHTTTGAAPPLPAIDMDYAPTIGRGRMTIETESVESIHQAWEEFKTNWAPNWVWNEDGQEVHIPVYTDVGFSAVLDTSFGPDFATVVIRRELFKTVDGKTLMKITGRLGSTCLILWMGTVKTGGIYRK